MEEQRGNEGGKWRDGWRMEEENMTDRDWRRKLERQLGNKGE